MVQYLLFYNVHVLEKIIVKLQTSTETEYFTAVQTQANPTHVIKWTSSISLSSNQRHLNHRYKPFYTKLDRITGFSQ